MTIDQLPLRIRTPLLNLVKCVLFHSHVGSEKTGEDLENAEDILVRQLLEEVRTSKPDIGW